MPSDPLDACQLVQLDTAPVMAGAPSREEPWGWYLRRRLRNLTRRLRPAPAAPPATGVRAAFEPIELQAGDRVRVRPREQIEATLDGAGALSGCWFAPQMFAHCGRELTVLTRVERFFDERRWRMLKARHMVVLEGVTCDGRSLPDTAGCDRRCHFFWRTEWLTRAG
jgi:hypothetical protein